MEKISDKICCFILKDLEVSQERTEIIQFGITRIIEDIPKAIGIALVGILLHILKEMLIVTIILALYKTFTGGVHCKTNLACFIHSVLFYIAVIYSAKMIPTHYEFELFLVFLNYVFALYCIFTYVPADVPEIPKVNIKLRKTLKIKSLVVLNLIYIITLLFVKEVYVQKIIMYSVFYIDLMTIRTVYRLFKCDYGFEVYLEQQ